MLRRLCHSYSAELPTQRLIKVQFRDRLCIPTRIAHQPILPGFRCQICRLVKLKFGDCLYYFCEICVSILSLVVIKPSLKTDY